MENNTPEIKEVELVFHDNIDINVDVQISTGGTPNTTPETK